MDHLSYSYFLLYPPIQREGGHQSYLAVHFQPFLKFYFQTFHPVAFFSLALELGCLQFPSYLVFIWDEIAFWPESKWSGRSPPGTESSYSTFPPLHPFNWIRETGDWNGAQGHTTHWAGQSGFVVPCIKVWPFLSKVTQPTGFPSFPLRRLFHRPCGPHS